MGEKSGISVLYIAVFSQLDWEFLLVTFYLLAPLVATRCLNNVIEN